jgi:transglutaminase-like putative cysteine protease
MKKIIIALLLLSQLSLFAQDYKFGKVSKAELEETFYPLDSTADAAYLYRKRRTYFDYISNQGFQMVTEVHERIKIYSKEGFNMATKSVAYYDPEIGEKQSVSSIKGYTYSLVDGKVVKEKLSKSSVFNEKKNSSYSIKKITMPNIKVGTVLDIKYRLVSPYTSSINDLEFQYGIPVKKLDYKIEIPEYFIFNKRAKGFYSIKMKEGFKNGTIGSLNYRIDVFSFDGNMIPALRDNEPFISSIRNYRGGMKFELTQTNFSSLQGSIKNFSNTWEDVSKQIFKSTSFGAELNKSSYYKKDLEKILATSKTSSDKIVSILNFVKKQVKWNGNYSKYTDNGVRKAYKERVGNVSDINLMLTSMLRSAGLNANPVLLSTRKNGIPFFPTLDGFNYVISIVDLKDGSSVLLDASEEFSLPNMLPTRTLNWKGRKVIKEGGSSWVELTSSKHTSEDNYVMVKISDDMMVEGMIRTKYDNLNALNYRKNKNHI